MPETGWKIFDRHVDSTTTTGRRSGPPRLHIKKRGAVGAEYAYVRFTAKALRMLEEIENREEGFSPPRLSIMTLETDEGLLVGFKPTRQKGGGTYALTSHRALGTNKASSAVITFNSFFHTYNLAADIEYEPRIDDGVLVIGPMETESQV